MRTMIVTGSLAAILFAASWSNADAGVSVEVSVGSPGYVMHNNYNSDYMDREDLIVIDNSQVGFWVMLPSGRWVFRCRSMWYDSGWDEWHYGPWWDNYSIAFSADCDDGFHLFNPYHGMWYHSYMYDHYPRYWERTYGHRALPFRERLERDARHMRPEDRRDRNWAPRSMAPRNHPATIIETTRIITPGRTPFADRNGGLRKTDNRTQPTVGATSTPRQRVIENSGRPANNTSGNRNSIPRERRR
jgi:hypothetical protein